MKRIIKLFSLLMMLSISLTSYAHDFEVDGLGYTIISTGDLTCEVSGLTNPDMKDIVIPETVTYMGRELSVIKIGKKAFADTEIESVTLNATISAVADECFMSCKNLRSVSPLTSVKYFGEKCFYECKALNNIEFNKELYKIELCWCCFAGCSSIESIVLHDNIVFQTHGYDNNSFSNSGLKKVEINCNVSCGTFSGCSSLTDVVLGSKCEEIDADAFQNCTSLTHIELPSSVKRLGTCCFIGCNSLETINIQNVNEIGYCCFAYCKSLKAIEYNAQELGGEIFIGCTNLEMVSIGSKTQIITNDAHAGHQRDASPFEGCEIKILKILPKNNAVTLDCPLLIDLADDDKKDDSMFNSIEELHLGCPMINKPNIYSSDNYKWNSSTLRNLKSLTFLSPYYLNADGYDLYIPWDQLTFLKSECLTPPELYDVFTNLQYTTMEVQVPFEALDAYKKADVWKEFWNLKGYDGVDDIPADNIDDDKVEVYNLHGMRMNISSRDELCKLQPGLYIINGKKEVVK